MVEQSSSEAYDDARSIIDSNCPACGSSRISEVAPSLDPVCDECGAIVSGRFEPFLPFEADDRIESTPSWSEYYTVTNSTEKRMAESLDVLESIGDRLHLNRNMREQAAKLYAEAALENLVDGRSTEVVVGAVVAHTARAVGEPRPNGCIAEAAGIRPKLLKRIIRLLSRELDLPTSSCPPEQYLPFLIQELQLDFAIEADSRRILESITGDSIGGKNPVGFAGAALYLAADGLVTQREIANAAGVTEETLRVRLRDCRAAEVM